LRTKGLPGRRDRPLDLELAATAITISAKRWRCGPAK
jgi:hypothetical protein